MPLPGAGCPFLTDWLEKLNGVNPVIVCRIGTVRVRDRTRPEDECERSASSRVTEAVTQKKRRPVAGPPSSQAGLENCQARRAIILPRRKAAPVSAKPPIIMAQLAGSGTGISGAATMTDSGSITAALMIAGVEDGRVLK